MANCVSGMDVNTDSCIYRLFTNVKFKSWGNEETNPCRNRCRNTLLASDPLYNFTEAAVTSVEHSLAERFIRTRLQRPYIGAQVA
jgi:hypothetical protein